MNPTRKKLNLMSQDASAFGGVATDEEDALLLVEEDTTDSSLIITMDEVKVKSRKRKRKPTSDEDEASESEPDIDRQLDQSLESKSKQHNLTAVNVKNILHEVITNEHVVAMMKAAINDTEAPPLFEPKMTRSKLKEVVEKGVVIPAWNLSPIKKHTDVNKPPQFVDMPLADEDSSDEEYRPDEEEEDETAEDTFHESDLESTASSPRGARLREESISPWQTSRSCSRRLRAEPVPMGPPPPPKTTPTRSQSVSDSSKAPPLRGFIDRRSVSDSAFLEKLHAVEEELSVCTQTYQPLQDSDVDLMAARTRSKRPLRDVPLGQLEAELRDLTPDFSETRSSLDPDPEEDRDWTDWLRGLMTSDMEEEADDEDDPEYNFLADTDEPDLEDYRDDRAVRITKKEVNELMEELFQTLKEDLTTQEVEDDGHEEEEELPETSSTQPRCEPKSDVVPVPDLGPECEIRTVKQQLDFTRRQHRDVPVPETTDCVSLSLNTAQRRRLCQQIQQHVQLLMQIHLLCSPVAKLQSEAQTTKQFLMELDFLGQGAELVMSSRGFHSHRSTFRVCNLQGALQLLEETTITPIDYRPPTPRANSKGQIKAYPLLPGELAWIFATRSVFLYPELLPCASLDPALYCPRRTNAFTAAEDCLLVLGLKHLESCPDPVRLVADLVLRRSLVQVRRRILQCCRPGNSDNIIKAFRFQKVLWPMPKACFPQTVERPPVERDVRRLPLWIARSLPVLHAAIRRITSSSTGTPPSSTQTPPSSTQTSPCSTETPPSSTGTPPSSTQTPPSSTQTPPCSTQTPPCSTQTPPCSTGTPPCSIGTPPCSTETPPCSTQTASCSTQTPSCSIGTPPCSTETPPCSTQTAPCSTQTPSCSIGTPPCSTQTAPCSTQTAPCSTQTPSCSTQAPPCSIGTPPCSIGTPPCPTQTPPCPTQTPPCSTQTALCSTGTPSCSRRTPSRSRGTHPRSSHLTLLRSDCSSPFPPGSVFPTRLPKSLLEFRRLGFVLLHPTPETPPIREQESSNGPVTEQEQVEDGPITEQERVEDGPMTEPAEDGPITEQEEECDFVLVLSDSSLSDTGSPLSNQGLDDTLRLSPEHRTGSDVRVQHKERVEQSGKRVARWTREADRELLLAVKKSGANHKTFRAVSRLLGNKTLAQVTLRFEDLMTLFYSSNHRATSCL